MHLLTNFESELQRLRRNNAVMRRVWEQVQRDDDFQKYVDTELRRPKFTPGGGQWTDTPVGQDWLPLPSLLPGIDS